MESFGFNTKLLGQAAGQAFPQSVFDHWELMSCFKSSSPLEEGGKVEDVIRGIRVCKGLKPDILQ